MVYIFIYMFIYTHIYLCTYIGVWGAQLEILGDAESGYVLSEGDVERECWAWLGF